MSGRARAARIIAKRQVFEALISPGFYLALVAGLFLGFFLVSGFARAVDSSGFNPQLLPGYDIISRALEGTFGKTFLDALFAEGPLPLAFAVSFLPAFLFISVSSVFKFGLEKSAGAVELVVYGPADGTAYLLASYVKDIFLVLLATVVILGFMIAAAPVYNLVAGPQLFVTALVAAFVSFSLFAYGVFASMVTMNASSSLALFLGIVGFFLAVFLGSFAIVGEYVRNLSTLVGSAVQWISPFFYANLALQSNAAADPVGFIGGLALMLALSAAILAASHFIIRARGVRA
jgi:hypothetical protein